MAKYKTLKEIHKFLIDNDTCRKDPKFSLGTKFTILEDEKTKEYNNEYVCQCCETPQKTSNEI